MTTRQQRNKVERLVNLFKQFIVFLISHVGLCALVIAYTMLGAVIFRAIEGQLERDTNKMVRDQREKSVDEMWEATYLHNILEQDKWLNKTRSAINDYRQVLMTVIQRKGYDARDFADNSQWTFSGAFFYSLTVITTIGYGNIACRTIVGRMTTILYAIIGIPIMLLFLTNVGDILAKSFKVGYIKFINLQMQCTLWHKRRKTERLRRTILEAKQNSTPFTIQTAASSSSSASHRTSSKQQNSQSNLLHDDNHNNNPGLNKLKTPSTGSRNESFLVNQSSSIEQMRVESLFHQCELDELEYRENMEEQKDKLNVPLWLVLLTMIAYLILGGILFNIWEGWPFEDSFYFCYVSLATIGFGDLFPGASLTDDSAMAQKNLIITSFYLLFGMALIAMCFNLAQEEVVTKITQLAIKLGIVRMETYEDEEEGDQAQTPQNDQEGT